MSPGTNLKMPSLKVHFWISISGPIRRVTFGLEFYQYLSGPRFSSDLQRRQSRCQGSNHSARFHIKMPPEPKCSSEQLLYSRLWPVRRRFRLSFTHLSSGCCSSSTNYVFTAISSACVWYGVCVSRLNFIYLRELHDKKPKQWPLMDIPIKLIVTNIKKRSKGKKIEWNRSENVIKLVYMHGVVRGSSINDRTHCRSMCLPNEGRTTAVTAKTHHALLAGVSMSICRRCGFLCTQRKMSLHKMTGMLD